MRRLMTTRAVILARGVGTRMRRADGVALSDAQANSLIAQANSLIDQAHTLATT
jgi:choline kinase